MGRPIQISSEFTLALTIYHFFPPAKLEVAIIHWGGIVDTVQAGCQVPAVFSIRELESY